jgi:hypothetical protein
VLADSYHCCRLNINTGKLSTAMFEAVFVALASCLGAFVPNCPERVNDARIT